MTASFPSTPLTTLLGSTGPVHAIAYSASPGTYILTGSSDRSIRLYNPFPSTTANTHTIQPSKLIQTYTAHGYEVLDLAVSRDNARFASVGGDRSVFLWDVATAKTIRRFGGNNGHTARINAVCFAGGEDAVLVSGSFDASVRLWDSKSQSHKPIQTLSEARDSVSCVMVNGTGGHEIVTGSVDGKVRYYDIRMGNMDTDVLGAPVTSLATTKDGEGVLVGTLDNAVRLMDRKSGACLMTYKGHENREYRVRSCFGKREAWVLSGSEISGPKKQGRDESGEVAVWDTVTGTVMAKVAVPGRLDDGTRKKIVGSDGQEKKRKNVISCVAWKDNGKGDQWCCGGTDGIVTVFGNTPR
jgi:mitogen-activated protein kinase organizer 1